MSGQEVEILDHATGELVPYTPPQPPATLFRSDDPAEILTQAIAVADTLNPVIRERKLFKRIGDKDHVFVEAWTLCGTMLGVFPVCVWTRPLENGWEARVEARTRDGAVVGSAESQCTRSESLWAKREDYALRSMAQTRATSKALRQPLGFIINLAGFSATPAEEMPRAEPAAPPPQEKDYDGMFPPKDQPRPGSREMSTENPALSMRQWRKLNVLVGTLRPAHIRTEHLYQAVGLDPAEHLDDKGELHWGPLRAKLTPAQANELIDRLSTLEQRVRTTAEPQQFEVPESAR